MTLILCWSLKLISLFVNLFTTTYSNRMDIVKFFKYDSVITLGNEIIFHFPWFFSHKGWWCKNKYVNTGLRTVIMNYCFHYLHCREVQTLDQIFAICISRFYDNEWFKIYKRIDYDDDNLQMLMSMSELGVNVKMGRK